MSVHPLSPLALRLRELRGSMTQGELAGELGCSAALVSSWEGALAVPPQRRLIQYAVYFQPARSQVLLDELSGLRLLAVPRLREPNLMEVMKDIRFLLSDIRDRMPPRGE